MKEEFKKGDIVFVSDSGTTTGSEVWGHRPAVIVSNNICNTYSPVLEIVYLTTKERGKPLPTHIRTTHKGKSAIILCEQILSVSKDRLEVTGESITAEEMTNMNGGLSISLGLTDHNIANSIMKKWEFSVLREQTYEHTNENAINLKQELEKYKKLYELKCDEMQMLMS